jgi:tetratricopeptide (TPR) repeat protein
MDLGFAPPAVLNNLGYSQLRLGHADEAQTHLEQALQQDPALHAAHFNLALVDALRINGQKQSLPVEGIKHVETALKLGPATADLCYCAAFLYAAATRQDVNQTPFALDQMEKALGLGCEPRKFEAFAQFEALAKEPRFNALLNRPAARNPAVSTPRLLDPLQDGPTR